MTRRQADLLATICLDGWTVPPVRTNAQTILSLSTRGLLKMRTPRGRQCSVMWKYNDCELQLTDKGHAELATYVHGD